MTKVAGLTTAVLAVLSAVASVTACSSNPAIKPGASMQLCNASGCEALAKSQSHPLLLRRIHELFARNLNSPAMLCEAGEGGPCRKEAICYFVLGGMLPGNGCAAQLVIKEVVAAPGEHSLRLTVDMPLSFIGTSVKCSATDAVATFTGDGILTIDFTPYHCSWLAVGQMAANFKFYVDRIDTAHGFFGGHWAHSVKGTGNGAGSGYALLTFSSNIDWQVSQ